MNIMMLYGRLRVRRRAGLRNRVPTVLMLWMRCADMEMGKGTEVGWVLDTKFLQVFGRIPDRQKG
jgi:hypothetical protein